ncbi:hypothetical protein [Undibacter mobilis]|uniref:Uncharacterized protein n=1 Tax=Undibacter mobilis TaxID=2292256 RepID=A0A371BBR5_9BRAD|nr:hypothetical protein [Undibacter mobilis]RDV05014.1 hypothetical protein DXH78_10830 [Undibacter mobilis]
MMTWMAAVKIAFSKLASRDFKVTGRALRVAVKGAFLVLMALMIVTYAVSVSQSAAPPPEPLPDHIYS